MTRFAPDRFTSDRQTLGCRRRERRSAARLRIPFQLCVKYVSRTNMEPSATLDVETLKVSDERLKTPHGKCTGGGRGGAFLPLLLRNRCAPGVTAKSVPCPDPEPAPRALHLVPPSPPVL